MRIGFLGLVMILFALAPLQAAEPRDDLKSVLTQLADKVKQVCGTLNPSQNSVAIGQFSGSQDALKLGVGGGSVMSELVSVLGSFVKPDAALELNGLVLLVDDPDAKGLKAIRIKAKLTNKNGDDVAEFKEFTGFVRNATDFARITGATTAFKPDGDYTVPPSQGRREDAQKVTPPSPGEKPSASTAFVDGSKIRSQKESKFDVEILCGATAKGPFTPLKATLEEKGFPGLPFVDVPLKHYYQVRITNRDDRRAGVFLHLDGIDQFHFSEDRAKDGKPKFKMWVVNPNETLTIEGYHKNVNPGEVFGFLTTQAGEGAASKFPTLSQGKVGTICVGLAREKAEGEKGSQETMPGDVIRVKQNAVEFRLGDISEFVTVRYSR